MKNMKTEFKFFTIFEWEKEQDYLREQQKNGWKFVRVNLIGRYHFEECEPEDVVYQLDYNPHGIAHKDEYVQMFRDCGWEYLQDIGGYSYFRKAASQMNRGEGIFCDDASKLDMLQRVFKGRMLPVLCAFFLIILPNLYIQSRFDTWISHLLTGTFEALFLLYMVLFLWFGVQMWRCRKKLCE